MPEILWHWIAHFIHPRPSGWHASHFLCFWLEAEVQTSCVCNFTSLWVLFFFFVLRQCMFLGIKASCISLTFTFFGSVYWGTFILCSSELKLLCKMTYRNLFITDYNILCVSICLLLEEGMATHSSVLACRIPWTEELGRLHSMVLKRVGHDRSDWALVCACVNDRVEDHMQNVL